LATRPVITQAPARIGYGASFTLGVADPAGVARISLTRLGSVTHAFDQNQRFVPITSFQAQGNALSVTAPSDRNIAPPGHYMLFVLNAQGVPSEARIVQLL
ncbi:MAG TPA: galactose oxidase early set domain-containing protein, partial [Gemmatimonadales bacterium]|nr:galactose oxidase early set domain-containing protein [Gemmatimonadales bacterium]